MILYVSYSKWGNIPFSYFQGLDIGPERYSVSDVASNFDIIGETCVGFGVKTCGACGSLYDPRCNFCRGEMISSPSSPPPAQILPPLGPYSPITPTPPVLISPRSGPPETSSRSTRTLTRRVPTTNPVEDRTCKICRRVFTRVRDRKRHVRECHQGAVRPPTRKLLKQSALKNRESPVSLHSPQVDTSTVPRK